MTIATRPLGRTGHDVTILSYGAMELRGEPRGPAVSDAAAEHILNTVLDSGINLIDTSIDYGHSEELIGKFLAHRRDEFFLTSKCGCPLESTSADPSVRPPHDFSSENVRAGVEQSLRRLKTDHLDLVQVHMSPSREVIESEGTVPTLLDLQSEGKVRFVGISGTIPHLSDHLAMGVFDVFQIPYSVIQREHEDLIVEASEAGAGTLIRGGAARGAPSPEKSWSTGRPGRNDRGSEAQSRWESAELDEFLGGTDRMELTLRFTLSHPGLSTTIVGTRNPDHLKANVAAAEKGPLPADLYDAVRTRLDEVTAP
jgi:aryl-alcohol dehydrogenase-like predicted oxidoreductase